MGTVNLRLAGVMVRFCVWDVDDPFDQLHADMPDVGVIDDDDDGADNRPTGSEGVWSSYQSTNENGQAIKTFTVSMQPGNNYRGAALCLDDAVDQVSQADADALSWTYDPQTQTYSRNGKFSGYQLPVVWSKMLTVWRKLHVETDSMARPTFGENTVTGQWNEPRFQGGQLWIDIPDQGNHDDFENGYILLQAAGFPDLISIIIDHDSSALDDPIHTNINEATWGARPSSGNFVASDDDLGDQGLFTAGVVGSIIGVGTPPDGFLLLPDTSELQAVYQPAYNLPVVEPQHTSEGACPFYKNFRPETKANWDPGRLVLRGLPVSTADFWTV